MATQAGPKSRRAAVFCRTLACYPLDGPAAPTPIQNNSGLPQGLALRGLCPEGLRQGAGLPYVEVHISSIAKRNIHCVLSDVAEGMITGFGIHSYILGLDAMLEILKRRTMGR